MNYEALGGPSGHRRFCPADPPRASLLVRVRPGGSKEVLDASGLERGLGPRSQSPHPKASSFACHAGGGVHSRTALLFAQWLCLVAAHAEA